MEGITISISKGLKSRWRRRCLQTTKQAHITCEAVQVARRLLLVSASECRVAF